MEANNTSRTSTQAKTSYFEKYRRELERISYQMKSKATSSSFSEQSDNMKQSSKKSVASDQKPTVPIVASPIKPTAKIARMEIQKEVKNVSKDEGDNVMKENEAKEIQHLTTQLELAKAKLAKLQQEASHKKSVVQSLKRQITQQSSQANKAEANNYAQKMLAIEAKLKFKKELHEQQLNRVLNQKDTQHSQNVQLSKYIQKLEEDLAQLTSEYNQSELDDPIQALITKIHNEEAQVAKLISECEQVEIKINNEEQLRQQSRIQFKRYVQVFKRRLIGKQIAEAQDRINERNTQKRFLTEIERKKNLIKEQKVDNFVRQKSVIEIQRVIDHLVKEIAQIKKEVASLSSEKKMFFKDQI